MSSVSSLEVSGDEFIVTLDWVWGSPRLGVMDIAVRVGLTDAIRRATLGKIPYQILGGFSKPVGDATDSPQFGESNIFQGSGICKWFNVRMGFGFLTMTNKEGVELEIPVDVFVHQSKLHMEGFRSLKEGEPVEFTFKKSSKGLESTRVTGPGGAPCIGSERKPKVKGQQKRKPKGDRCYNCGGLDHHAKECSLPPQPKKCHFCQSTSHMVAQCPLKGTQQGKLDTEESSPSATE